ncbi:hypothetical protein F5Y19DRAFT_479945 [Xylariaceae sp. FL1651]|nr:hypothetical protein F5Y19DRAFT_479945 [Xylariaceae sp. FL1651]
MSKGKSVMHIQPFSSLPQKEKNPRRVAEQTILQLEQDKLLWNSVSRLRQPSATSNYFSAQAKQDTSPRSSYDPFLAFPKVQRDEAYDTQDFHPSTLSRTSCEAYQQQSYTSEVGPEYLGPHLLHFSLDCNQFHEATSPPHPEQVLLDHLSKVNRAYDSLVSLQRDTSCCGTYVGWEFSAPTQICPSPPSIEDLFYLSQQFSFILNAMTSAGTLTTGHIADSALVFAIHSRIRDIHNIVAQLTTRSLQLSRDAVGRMGDCHKLCI